MALTNEDKEVLERYRKSIHIPTPAEERETYIQAILTSTFYPYFKETTKEMSLAFSKVGLKPNTTQSYFVYGANQDILYKFAAFCIINGNRNFSLYFVKDLTERLMSDRPEDTLEFKNDLLIIYNHKHLHAIGLQQDLYYSSIINRVVERNRKKLPTLILSEIKEPMYEKSEELEIIDLSKVLADAKYKPAEAVKAIQTRKSVVSNPQEPQQKREYSNSYGNFSSTRKRKEKSDYLRAYQDIKEQE